MTTGATHCRTWSKAGKPPRAGAMSRPSKILITGSSGYCGRTLARHFTGKGIPVVGLDLEPAGPPEVTFVRMDVRDARSLARAMADHEPSHVIHLALPIVKVSATATHTSEVKAQRRDASFSQTMCNGPHQRHGHRAAGRRVGMANDSRRERAVPVGQVEFAFQFNRGFAAGKCSS